MANIPDIIKKNVRAVLLSKKGGVLVSDFTKDYKALLKEPLKFKDLGFSNIKAFIDAIPECVRLEFDDGIMAYRMFGVGDPTTFMTLSQKKAQGNPRGRTSHHLPPKTSPNQALSRPDLEDKLVPNIRGHISVCYDRNKEEKDITEEEILEKFSEFGEVAEVHMIPKLIFVRYKSKEPVIAAINKYETELGCRVAVESSQQTGKGKRNSSKSTVNDKTDYLMERKTSKKEPIEVFLSNINNESTKEELSALCAEFGPKYIRRIAKDDRRVFAFIGFSENQRRISEEMIEKFDGMNWKGRKLSCRFVKEDPVPKDENPPVVSFKPSTNTVAPKPNPEPESDCAWDDDIEDPSIVKSVRLNGTWQHIAPAMSPTKPLLSPSSSAKPFISPLSLEKPSASPLSPEKPSVSLLSPAKSFTSPLSPAKPLITPSNKSLVAATSDVDFRLAAESMRSNIKISDLPQKFEELSIKTDFGTDSFIRQVVSPAASNHGNHRYRRINSIPLNGYEDQQDAGLYDDMPQLVPVMPEEMPPLKQSEVGVFVGNFPFGMSDEELMGIFAKYSPVGIKVMNRDQYNSSSKAIIYVEDMEHACLAVKALNQSYYKRRRLLVDIDNNHPDYEQNRAVYKRIEPKTENDRYINPQHQRPPGSYQGSPSSDKLTASKVERSPSLSSISSSGSGSSRSFTSLLATYKIIMKTLQKQKHYFQTRPLKESKIFVLITSVYDESHFWAHVIQDDSIKCLEHTMLAMQEPDIKIGRTKGLGRCAALFDSEWFRAWIISDNHSSATVDVFYVDYGNISRIEKCNTSLTIPDVWETEVNLYPFQVADGSKTVTKDMENKIVCLEVKDTGIDETEYLNEVLLMEVLS